MTEDTNPDTNENAFESTPNDRDEPRGERIAKYLARAGVASRRDVERMITERRIRIGGKMIEHPATFVQRGDIVIVDNKPIDHPDRTRLWRYHKPDGLMTTHKDPQGRPTVFESLPEGLPRVISVGRLDINSEGLLLLTNDGELARRLELPGNAWIRRYRVRVFGVVDEKRLASLIDGFEYEGIRYGSIEAALDSSKGDNSWLTVSLREGKNREIRNVMRGLNLHVSRLIRLSYGPFQLGSLKARELTEVAGKTLREQIPELQSSKGNH
ncbi:tRNA/rRNA pseudouridine synthase [Neokomagataea thailandica NBRC 106555]|uniref:Pseudouridine synthase n=2 Tax=Neokomagataea TaxID=1223423 RepID=A0A4Y6V3G6_9PROT|nr:MULTISPECIES: pseudouridine synthase [Neokomagataea]QDH24483.1 rRNA pseudouridine synthase [Neokomagataea tanensis]GBR55489.1 tRNA/rRNA pseudouridine synthase [Neokomagataea thailandica NBRC 106555]